MSEKTPRRFRVESETQMVALGSGLAALVPGGSYVSLDGPLAAGKTTFARGFVTRLGHSGAVKSPTFTLVESYVLPSVRIHHFDLYRLADAEELEFIGVEDYFESDTIVLIEWPERGRGVLPPADIEVQIEIDGSARWVVLSAPEKAYSQIVSSLKIV